MCVTDWQNSNLKLKLNGGFILKFNKILKRAFAGILSAIFIIGGSSAYYAATKEYSFSALNTQVNIPSELSVFTRSVTSADPGLDLIDTTADKLHVMFEQYNIYLEAFPSDVSYEIVVSGNDAPEDAKNFNEIGNSLLNEQLQDYKAKCEAVDTDEINDVTTYKNNTTNYFQTDFKSVSNGVTVYVRKYYTIMQGKEISFTIQSNGKELTDEQISQLQEIVDGAQFKEIKESITESPIFTEITGYLIGILITVAVLGGLVYVVNKSNKKQKRDEY